MANRTHAWQRHTGAGLWFAWCGRTFQGEYQITEYTIANGYGLPTCRACVTRLYQYVARQRDHVDRLAAALAPDSAHATESERQFGRCWRCVEAKLTERQEELVHAAHKGRGDAERI